MLEYSPPLVFNAFCLRLNLFSRHETYRCGIAERCCGGIKGTQRGVSWHPLHLLGVATSTHPCRLSVDLCRIQGATGTAESDDITQLGLGPHVEPVAAILWAAI